MSSLAKVIVIVGPTASGKSALAVVLAKKFNGEVISADSRQVYRGMNIGTGKVPISHARPKRASAKLSIPETAKQLSGISGYWLGIPHHLLDVTSPKKTFTVADYQKRAQAAMKKILARHKVPIICGGTGLYIDAALYNYALPEVKANPKLRHNLEKESAESLFAQLEKRDPVRAANIDPWNKRRLIRALEIIAATKNPVPSHETALKQNANYDVLKLGIKLPDAELKSRIGRRLRERLAQGMVAEVKKLHAGGVSWKRLENFGLEYRFIAQYLQGKINKAEMIGNLEMAIWHYAKRQMTWFKRDTKTFWTNNKKQAEAKTKEFLQ